MHDSISIFKKETNILIDSFSVNVNNIDRIDSVVRGDHGTGTFRFIMKLMCVMDDGETFEREAHIR